jgi:hypothetical protein
MKRAVLGLKKRLPETTFLCLSNSNEVYIKTILEVSLRSLSVLGAQADNAETWPIRPL